MKQTLPEAPAHLQPSTRAWWESVVTHWGLQPHHVHLLTLCCEALDRGEQAREQLAREGLFVPTKAGGPRLNPAVKVKEQAEIAFARLLRELDLDLDGPVAASRPAPLRSLR